MCSQLLWCEAPTNQQRALMAKKVEEEGDKKVSAGDIRWMKQEGKGENYI